MAAPLDGTLLGRSGLEQLEQRKSALLEPDAGRLALLGEALSGG